MSLANFLDRRFPCFAFRRCLANSITVRITSKCVTMRSKTLDRDVIAILIVRASYKSPNTT